MPYLVSIPIASITVIIRFARPCFNLLLDHARIVDAFLEVFSTWNLGMDEIEITGEGKLSEHNVHFRSTWNGMTFVLGVESCTLVRERVDWVVAEETIEILSRAFSVVQDMGEVETGSYLTELLMHLQPETARVDEILRPFAPQPLLSLEASALEVIGSVVKWDKRRVTLDRSDSRGNGVMVLLEREFARDVSFADVAIQMGSDQRALFERMDVVVG